MSHQEHVAGSEEIETLVIRRSSTQALDVGELSWSPDPKSEGSDQGAESYMLHAATRHGRRSLTFSAEQLESWHRDRSEVEDMVDEWMRTL